MSSPILFGCQIVVIACHVVAVTDGSPSNMIFGAVRVLSGKQSPARCLLARRSVLLSLCLGRDMVENLGMRLDTIAVGDPSCISSRLSPVAGANGHRNIATSQPIGRPMIVRAVVEAFRLS